MQFIIWVNHLFACPLLCRFSSWVVYNNNMCLVPGAWQRLAQQRDMVFSALTPVPLFRQWLKQVLLGNQPVVKSQKSLFPGAQLFSQLPCFCMFLVIWDSATIWQKATTKHIFSDMCSYLKISTVVRAIRNGWGSLNVKYNLYLF